MQASQFSRYAVPMVSVEPKILSAPPHIIVWSTDVRALEDLQGRISKALEHQAHVLVVSHFPKQAEKVNKLLQTSKLPTQKVEYGPELAIQNPTVFTILSKDVSPAIISATQQLTRSILIITTELGPAPLFEERTAGLLAGLPLARLYSYELITSLESPLYELFGGEQFRQILVQFGLAEDKPLQGDAIGASILRAQARIGSLVKSDKESSSVGEWITQNLRTIS